jgi:cell division transport system ATP-binding protein
MLALKNVTKAYGNVKVLSGASLEMKPKDNVCIIGEGGSGKSTLLKLFARQEDPTSGTVLVDGIDLKAVPPAILQLYRRRLGLSFQEPLLLMHATVSENIALPLELFGASPAIIKRTTDDLMKRLGLTDKAMRFAGDLSVSERSLVGIARSIIASPMIVIADEPLLHLDATQAKAVVELLKNMHAHGTTLVLLSRSAQTARAFGARTVALKNGVLSVEKQEVAPPAKTVKAADTHRILEETENRIHSIFAMPQKKAPAKHEQKGDGKKIRITSIGSGL